MANEFRIKNGLIVDQGTSQISGSLNISGSTTVSGSLNVTQGITGSLFGTSSWASNALTASFVTTLNQNVLITGSLTVGTGSLGPSENTITLGARDSGGEGGQLGFNASGGTYTSASMIDLYQNRLRILRGTNAGSDAEVAWWSMHNKQMALPAYNSVSAFAGTATALLAVDTGGNVITVATGSGGGGSGTVTNVATAGTVNGITLTGGPITTTGTITLGGTLSNVQSSQLATSSLMIGNSSISLGATASSLTGLTSVTATSFLGTASWATNASKVLVSTNAENVAFKVPFAATNVSTTGTYDLQQDSETTFTYNPSTNTLTVPNLAGTASWATNATTATSANTLTNTRTIWGQNFNGSANVTGNLTSVGTISGSTGVDLDIIAGAGARVTLMNPDANAVRFGTNNTVRWSVDGSTGNLISVGAQTIKTNTGNLTLATDAGNGNILLTPNGTGKVGIGTSSPNRKLTVSDSQAYIALNNTGGTNTTIGSDGVGSFIVYDDTAAAYRLVINSSGNVGIGTGTTSPSQKLHVSGSARITGAIYDSSNSAGTSGQVLSSTGTGTAWVTSGGGGSAFPYTGSALITGSLGITGSLSTTGSDAFINGVRVGRGKGNIITNTAVGTGSLSSITTGPENTAVGQNTLRSTTTGGYNTAVGSEALFSNAGGGYNVAVGRRALYNNSAGNGNTAVGYNAGASSTGDNNIIIGFGLDSKPDNTGFNGSYTLSIGKDSTDIQGYPHIWAPETVTISTSTNTTILTVDPSTYSGFFLEYVFDDTNGTMRSGTIKAVFTSTMSSIEWSEVDELTIGDTSLAIFSVVDNGSGQIEVRLDNTTGATMYCNFTSRLILRQL